MFSRTALGVVAALASSICHSAFADEPADAGVDAAPADAVSSDAAARSNAPTSPATPAPEPTPEIAVDANGLPILYGPDGNPLAI